MSRALRSMLAVGTAAAMGLSLSACSLLPFGNQTHSTSLKVGSAFSYRRTTRSVTSPPRTAPRSTPARSTTS